MATSSEAGGCEAGSPTFVVVAPLALGSIGSIGAEELPAGTVIMTFLAIRR